MEEKEIKNALNEYSNSIEKLHDGGIIRSSKVVGDYAEYLITNRLNLNLERSAINRGYDATDAGGRKYEIKARKDVPWNKATNFDVRKSNLDNMDFLICVLFDTDWSLKEVTLLPRKNVKLNKDNKNVLNKDLKRKYSILNSNGNLDREKFRTITGLI